MNRLALVFLLLAACKDKPRPPTVTTSAAHGSAALPSGSAPAVERDPHSDSHPDEARVSHLSLDLTVDFTKKTIAGVAKLTITRTVPKATVHLDVGQLVIEKTTACDSDVEITTRAEPSSSKKPVGQQLEVLTEAPCIAIYYATPTSAEALLWLDPSLTAGKKQPMLFTQAQPTLARTWIPLQDTPGVRFTYDAKIHVPIGAMALMSATNPQKMSDDGVYTFTMDKPIPSYLVALAVGDFAFKEIGPRTGVYAEPSVLDAAAYEFAETEKMIDAAEKLYGPYRWGRYDMLVLPPSFPFGGMENPKLTFLTPTVLTGDRALVALIAHELAHSWSGNLVTNSTWNDVWLNEGMTTYVERRIMEELRGTEENEVQWELGRMDLDDIVADPATETRLATTFKTGEDPESAPSDVAYEKGALFLRTLEHAFGRETFDKFLRARFDRLAFTSSDTAAFERDVAPLFAAAKVDFTAKEWLHDKGVPKSAVSAQSPRVAMLEGEAAAFVKSGKLPDARTWGSIDWTVFLRSAKGVVDKKWLAALDAKYALTKTTNALIAFRWFAVAIRSDYRAAAPQIEAFLMKIGRRWLVRSTYEEMNRAGGFWRDLALKTFENAKVGYHALTRDTIAEMLGRK